MRVGPHEHRKPHPVRHLLLDRGEKLVTVCERRGLNYEATRRAVNGQTRPTWEVAEEFSRDLGLPVDVLFRVDELREDREVNA